MMKSELKHLLSCHQYDARLHRSKLTRSFLFNLPQEDQVAYYSMLHSCDREIFKFAVDFIEKCILSSPNAVSIEARSNIGVYQRLIKKADTMLTDDSLQLSDVELFRDEFAATTPYAQGEYVGMFGLVCIYQCLALMTNVGMNLRTSMNSMLKRLITKFQCCNELDFHE